MTTSIHNVRPFKTITDRRLAYLDGLAQIYREQGYGVKVDGFRNLLEVYQKGVEVPKSAEEIIIQKWID